MCTLAPFFRLHISMDCDIEDIVNSCAYNGEGITGLQLLDLANVGGVQYSDLARYDVARVENILTGGNYIDISTHDGAQYNSELNNRLYTHTITTFVRGLDAQKVQSLIKAVKRRYVAIFTTKTGNKFIFGQDSGATVNFSGRTNDGNGYFITIMARSRFPLFEFVQADPFIAVNPAQLTIQRGKGSPVVITSTSSWTVQGSAPAFLSIAPNFGNAGSKTVTVVGVAVGSGNVTFVNTEGETATLTVNVVEVAPHWILEDGYWSADGVWTNDGIWQ